MSKGIPQRLGKVATGAFSAVWFSNYISLIFGNPLAGVNIVVDCLLWVFTNKTLSERLWKQLEEAL